MAGVPPLFGFVAKEVLLKALEKGPAAEVLLGVVTLAAALTATMALILFWDVFMGKYRVPSGDGAAHSHHPLGDDARAEAPHHHEAPFPMAVGAVSCFGSRLARVRLPDRSDRQAAS